MATEDAMAAPQAQQEGIRHRRSCQNKRAIKVAWGDVTAASDEIVVSETIFHNSEIRQHSENDLVRRLPKAGWTSMQEVESKIITQRDFYPTFGNLMLRYSPDASNSTIQARLRVDLNLEEKL